MPHPPLVLNCTSARKVWLSAKESLEKPPEVLIGAGASEGRGPGVWRRGTAVHGRSSGCRGGRQDKGGRWWPGQG